MTTVPHSHGSNPSVRLTFTQPYQTLWLREGGKESVLASEERARVVPMVAGESRIDGGFWVRRINLKPKETST
jgi:hypothetical protein